LSGVVLCYCKSGSGASLGACDSKSVFGPVEGPVVQPTCLTGTCCLAGANGNIRACERRPNGWMARVQRRVNDFVEWLSRRVAQATRGNDRSEKSIVYALRLIRRARKTRDFQPTNHLDRQHRWMAILRATSANTAVACDIVQLRCCDLGMVSVHGEASPSGRSPGYRV